MNNNEATPNTAAEIAADLRAALKSGKLNTDALVARSIAWAYRVNSNKASHALRMLEADGTISRNGISVAGNIIYRVNFASMI